MDMVALNEARRHSSYIIACVHTPDARPQGHGLTKSGLAIAAAYIALGIAVPWLLLDAPPSLYEIVATRACATGSPPKPVEAPARDAVATFD
jgi:hypothetical protein